MHDESLDALKDRLRSYKKEEIIFNEPHFTNRLLLREGNREEVIKNLLKSEKLVYYYIEQGKYGDDVYCLHFNISNTRTMKLPIIFDKNNERNLYVITYIMRYRPWQSMIRRGRR